MTEGPGTEAGQSFSGSDPRTAKTVLFLARQQGRSAIKPESFRQEEAPAFLKFHIEIKKRISSIDKSGRN
ncbi:MAG: hypothetical protein IKI69_03555 [Oscillospiraceae bacterium]|nr:hypothetical protein [Oscillospiraceae bacterium]